MKKIALLTAVLLLLLALAGCSEPSHTNVPDPSKTPDTIETPSTSEPPNVSETPSESKPSKIDDIPFAEGQWYAVACLGYEGTDGLSAYTEKYLDSNTLPIHHVSSGEYYLIIPRYTDMTLRLYRNSMDTAERTLIFEETECHPFVVQCNVSDIFPDVTVQLTYQGETVEFSPYISLKDGSVQAGDRGLDITMSS